MEHRQLRRDQPGFASFRMPCRLGLGETDDHKAHGGVYTIERLPESPVKDDHGVLAGLGGFSPTGGGQQHRKSKVATLAAALLLGTIIVLLTTAALVYTLRTVHTTYRTSPATTSSWASEMIVTGEFRLTNEPFRTSLYNLSSPDFKQLSRRIEKELERLYGDSGLKDEVLGVAVTSFSPGLEVRCSLTLLPRDSLTIGKVGLTFLAGLNQSHGHLWLGPFAVDVLSIGFQARTEEVSWSQWSDWSSCQTEDGTGRLVRTRRRVCLSLEGLKLSRAQPCQAISKPVITNDTEVQLCPQPDDGAGRRKIIVSSTPKAEVKEMRSEEVMRKRQPVPSRAEAVTLNLPLTTASPLRNSTEAAKSLVPFTTTAAQSDSTTAGHEVTAAPTTASSTTPTTTTTTPVPERIGCSSCEINEVCVALEGDPVPLCRPILDHDDPTGCGGLCQLNTEVCHRLGQGAYRCVDDSKCLDNEWQCGNMLCIPLIKRCDGHFNCYDHTDEHNCECDLNTHFQCGKNLSCLPQSKRCDGIVDCWDAADESNCTIACLDQTQFTCNDSQCIPSKNFCDGFIDCKDHSDEPFGCGGVCKNHEWRCRNGRCIVKRDVCNGQDDCGDFSDEIKCGKRRAGRK